METTATKLGHLPSDRLKNGHGLSTSAAAAANTSISATCSASVGHVGQHSDEFLNGSDDRSFHLGDENFDGLDIGSGDQVPLGEILDKLQAVDQSSVGVTEKGNLIRLHAVDGSDTTISATVNVATLDLTDPESIHQHLSQLNDTVLKVSVASEASTSSSYGVTAHVPSTSVSAASVPESPSSSTCSSSYLAPPALPASPHPPITLPTSPCPLSLPPTSPGRRSASASPSGSKSTPQTCSICLKVFSNASALAKHRLTHSEERRYHCSICGKAFKRQDHLNGHLLTHRSTKPFACSAAGCAKSYCDARSLRRHKENHHNMRGKKEDARSPDAVATVAVQPTTTTITSIKHTGLTAEQFQVIERIMKETGGNNKEVLKKLTPQQTPVTAATMQTTIAISSTSSPPTLSPKTVTEAQKQTFQLATAAAFKAQTLTPTTNHQPVKVQTTTSQNNNGVPDSKPVECTICNRKFKNIPALNGHMRLHGGYYKKDADGKRIIPTTPKVNGDHSPTTTSVRALIEEKIKRKPVKLEVSSASNGTPSFVGLEPPPPKRVALMSTAQPPPQGSLAFQNLPPPDTSKLLENLERKTQPLNGQLPPGSINLLPPRLPTVPLPVTTTSVSSRPPPSCIPTILASKLMSPLKHQTTLQLSTLAPVTSRIAVSAPSRPAPPPLVPPPRTTPNVLKVDESLDKTPKVGPEFQANIPDLVKPDPDEYERGGSLMWDPETLSDVDPDDLETFLKVASSCAIPGGSRNEEQALYLLQRCSGNVKQALQELLLARAPNECNQSESQAWSELEVNSFYEGLIKHHKNFYKIAKDLCGAKTTKHCVEFYYTWKNLCREESQSFKGIYSSPSSSSSDGGLTTANPLK